MDVVIIGGGLSGVAAAVSAAKEGAKVALIERAGFLGGLATGGEVGPILGLTVP
ncbi:MAG: FAD-dependent oxidoreductase, partial [Candidatus Omnitrophica bacterium]|nr:FAD-dependent oxidoreductase [Candidatus Omnitrophota bacterium]